jgi:hypothetical protein
MSTALSSSPFLRISGTSCSELEGTDDEEYPENQGIDPD